MLWWIWILLGFFLLVVELLTPGGLYLLFFGIAAVVVGLLAGLELSGPPWMQWLLFSTLSVVALVLFRRPLLQKLRPSTQGKEIDSLVGETALTLEDIAVEAIGKAELRGSSWSARNVGTTALARGQRCKVEKVDGLMLWVRG
jgi:membrane protein implicated in regulation of membrane protease activity